MRWPVRILALAAAVTACTAAMDRLYRRYLRQRVLTWGATADEATRRLPGDELLDPADIVATRAIGIDAPPSAIWPWLVQIGPGRAGAPENSHVHGQEPNGRGAAVADGSAVIGRGPAHHVGGGGQLDGQDHFESHQAIQPFLPGLEHHSHAATGVSAKYFITRWRMGRRPGETACRFVPLHRWVSNVVFWKSFVVLCLLGTIAKAVAYPVFLFQETAHDGRLVEPGETLQIMLDLVIAQR